MKEREYQCAVCKGVFEPDWTEEEAIAEAKENFGEDVMNQPHAVVCDVCYQKMIKEMPPKLWRQITEN